MFKLETFDTYQSLSDTTAIFPKMFALEYCTLGLAGEAGELCGVVKKVLRGDYLTEPSDGLKVPLYTELPREQQTLVAGRVLDEAGDVLWYLAQALRAVGYTLSDCAEFNIRKLQVRRDQDAIKSAEPRDMFDASPDA